MHHWDVQLFRHDVHRWVRRPDGEPDGLRNLRNHVQRPTGVHRLDVHVPARAHPLRNRVRRPQGHVPQLWLLRERVPHGQPLPGRELRERVVPDRDGGLQRLLSAAERARERPAQLRRLRRRLHVVTGVRERSVRGLLRTAQLLDVSVPRVRRLDGVLQLSLDDSADLRERHGLPARSMTPRVEPRLLL
jgi:hypothetical protein